MKTPQRIQRKRAKGWRLPPNTVCVTRPGKWGNPFCVADVLDACHGNETEAAADCVRSFRSALRRESLAKELGNEVAFPWARRIGDSLPELRGKHLACWCAPGTPCHAAVLLEIANA